MSQNEFGRSNQVSQNRLQKNQTQSQQISREIKYPVRTSNTTYEYRSNQSRVAPVRSSANTTQNLNRQAAGNPVVKNQIQGRAAQQECANSNTNSSANIHQSQSRVGRTYVYQPASRREYITNETRGHRGVSMETQSNFQNSRVRYDVHSREEVPQSIGLNSRYRNNIYVSGSGSPGFRRYVRNMDEESTYKSYIRGGIVKLRKWKYTTQTEINKIILIQRYWRYVLLRRIEKRQTLLSQSSEQKSENEIQIENESSNSERYNENERYGRINYVNYGNENLYRTETNVRRNAREKIIAGTKNRYIVETTTIEVFKNQNTVLKKVEPEILEKETKKIKRKGIKEQMAEIWITESVPASAEAISIIAETDVQQYTQIIEEYEETIKQIKSNMVQYEEEIIELTNKLKSYEKKDWNKINRERKESRITYRRKERSYLEIIEIFMKMRKPLQYRKESEVKILGKSKLHVGKKMLIVEERDAINIKGEEIQMNQVEYIDEFIFDSQSQPENEMQIVDQMEILKTEKEQHQWITIPSDEQKITILKQAKPENAIVERDSILIPALENVPNEVEYVDELFLDEIPKQENIIQTVEQIEIFGEKQLPKAQNIPQAIYQIELLSQIIPENIVDERDSLIIPGQEKEQNQVVYIDELFLDEIPKPENMIQIVDQMDILKEEKPENEIVSIDSIELVYEIKGEWIAMPSEGDKLTIYKIEKPDNEVAYPDEITLLPQDKPENVVEERDSIDISGNDKDPNQVEYIDELAIEEMIKPENNIQVVDQMEILKEEKPANEIAYIEELNIPPMEKEPLFVEYADTISIVVDRNQRDVNKMKKCIVQERDSI